VVSTQSTTRYQIRIFFFFFFFRINSDILYFTDVAESLIETSG
jgi:hypothetical protein